jgi:hypothetical protein
MNLMNVVISRLCFVSDCIFFYKLNADYVLYPAVTGELTSVSSSLLWTRVATTNDIIVATGVFGPSLLSYHCSDALVVTGRLPVATVTYNPLLQCLIVVVQGCHTRKQLHVNLIKSSIKLLRYSINDANIDLSSKVIIISLDCRKLR